MTIIKKKIVEKKQRIPIGIDNFEQLRSKNYYFVDKSLLIQELLDSGAAVTLIPRPRRFGKTLNLSMLRYFFEKSAISNRHLFNGLAIEQHPEYMEYQGNYPVIWLTFKDVKTGTWPECYRLIQMQIKDEFERHRHVQEILSETERDDFERILKKSGDITDFMKSLFDLSTYLERFHKTKVIILIDEYDSPIHAGYTGGYYDEIINFMRIFLGAGLKSNNSLEMSVLTGILRIAKESIFSGLNNLEVRTLFNQDYADKFGFLEHEVIDLINTFGLKNSLDTIRSWYNGYQCGPYKVYNPWSILSLIKNHAIVKPYWVNTSENLLIQNVLQTSTPEVKDTIEKFMRGYALPIPIEEYVTLAKIDKSETSLWNLLLYTGYLTFQNCHQEDLIDYADLKIPNKEILLLFKTIILSWFEDLGISPHYTQMLNQLINGNATQFKNIFEQFSYQALSSFDVSGKEPERFYHALALGMFVALHRTHHVRSNRESGLGRYDVCLTPKDLSKPGIILEFKKIDVKKNETLEAIAQQALAQIEDRDYEAEMRTQGITHIIKLGIAFAGKECLVVIG